MQTEVIEKLEIVLAPAASSQSLRFSFGTEAQALTYPGLSGASSRPRRRLLIIASTPICIPASTASLSPPLRDDNKDVAARMRELHTLCDEHGDVATASLLEVWIDEAEQRL